MGKSFQHLDLGDRATIQAQLTLGMRPGAIATVLNRARSTITREMYRNGWMAMPRMGTIAGGYRSAAADRRARVLAAKPRRGRKLKPGNPLWARMLEQLQQGFSPVQIASILARMANPVQISHETIYTALYAMPRGQLRANMLDLLRRHHKARRVEAKNRRSRSIPDMTLIEHRPIEVSERLVPGHWEGDLIIGKGNLSQVGTLVERTTLFVALVKLSDAKADTVAKGFSTFHDVRSGQRNEPTQNADKNSKSRRLLRSSPRSLGEGNQRKHEWTTPRLSAKGNRPLPVLAEAARCHCMATEHQGQKNSRLEISSGALSWERSF
jgi:transposase, IS30 family